MKHRTYFDVDGRDRSDLGGQVSKQRERVRERLDRVRRVILVASGKGGVGKSYVAASLAMRAACRGPLEIGVLDADLTSPTMSRLLDAQGPLRMASDGVHPAIGKAGTKVVSTDLLLEEGRPLQWSEPNEARFAWRGAMHAGVLREFLSDTVWGDLDVLFVDAPPGTSVMSDLHDLVPAITGVLFVTIPSIESARSVARTIRVAMEEGIPLLGIVENMSGLVCDACGSRQALFRGKAGNDLASEFGIPLLGQLPFTLAPADQPAAVPPGVLDALLETER